MSDGVCDSLQFGRQIFQEGCGAVVVRAGKNHTADQRHQQHQQRVNQAAEESEYNAQNQPQPIRLCQIQQAAEKFNHANGRSLPKNRPVLQDFSIAASTRKPELRVAATPPSQLFDTIGEVRRANGRRGRRQRLSATGRRSHLLDGFGNHRANHGEIFRDQVLRNFRCRRASGGNGQFLWV